MTTEQLTELERLYVIEVRHPLRGPVLVGPWYRDKAACHSWVSFVKSAYHGARTRVRAFTREQAQAIQDNGGQLQPTKGRS